MASNTTIATPAASGSPPPAAAAILAVVTTESHLVVAPTTATALAPPAMGAIKKVPSSTIINSTSISSAPVAPSSPAPESSAGLKSDPTGADQEISSSDTFARSLSGSRLNAKAPEFVPKGTITQPLVVISPTLISASSLPIPGVLPMLFPDAIVAPVRFDSAPPVVATPANMVASPPSPPVVPEFDESFVPDESSSSPKTHTTPPHHSPHKVVVNEELKAKIVKQVEFYFSDQNLPTDNYLMKFVKKDPDGFVPIPVVASFRKIKNLVKNHGVVAAALRGSTQLVVSDDGKKVRRIQPLPQVDLEEVQSRTVVAENLPEDHSVERLEQLFGSVGNVKMVRICQPEAANGANQTAAKFKSDMVVSNKLHALVEFETLEQAEKAVVALTDQGNWRSGLRVRLLLRRTFQSKHGFQQAPFQKGRKVGTEESGEEDENGFTDEKVSEDSSHHHDRSEEAPGSDSVVSADREAGMRKGKGRGRGRGAGGRKGQQGGSHHVGSNGSRTHQLGTSPQSHTLVGSEVVGRPPPGPRMPDGTRGFTLGRGKVPILGSA